MLRVSRRVFYLRSLVEFENRFGLRLLRVSLCARAFARRFELVTYAMLSMSLPSRLRARPRLSPENLEVELNGIEPMTSGLQSPRSPN